MITKADLERWKKIEQSATPGRWFIGRYPKTLSVSVFVSGGEDHIVWMAHPSSIKNLEFIVASREAMPALIAEVERLREELEAVTKQGGNN